MAGYVWTSILYICTIAIVYVSYRAFVFDRKAESESKMNDMINRSYGKGAAKAVGAAGLAPVRKISRLEAGPVVKTAGL